MDKISAVVRAGGIKYDSSFVYGFIITIGTSTYRSIIHGVILSDHFIDLDEYFICEPLSELNQQ